MSYGFSDGSRNFRSFLTCLLRSYRVARTDKIVSIEYPHLVPRLHTGDLFRESHPSYQVTKLVCWTYCFASASSAGSPCHLGSQAYFAISVFWQMSFNTVLPKCHFRRTLRIRVMRNVCRCRHFCIFEIFCELLQPFWKISQTVIRIFQTACGISRPVSGCELATALKHDLSMFLSMRRVLRWRCRR